MLLNRVENADVQNKKVILSIDTDRTLNNQGELIYQSPLENSIATIELLLDRGASVLITSSSGTTKDPISLENICNKISELLKRNIEFISMPLDSASSEKMKSLKSGELFFLDNLFKEPEESSKEKLAKDLAQFADIYVNDAINSLLLQSQSMLHLPELLPSYAGIHFFKAIELLGKLETGADRPFVLVLGGNQVETQINLVKRFFEKVQKVIIGGAVAYTFLKSRAVPIGNSLVDSQFEIQAFQMIEQADLAEAETILPIDHLAGDQFSKKAKTKKFDRASIPEGWFALDIASKTLSVLEKATKKAGTVLWYGPLGAIEFESGRKSTWSFAKHLSKIKGQKIVIGYDTALSIYQSGFSSKMDLCIYNSKVALMLIHKKPIEALQSLVKTKKN